MARVAIETVCITKWLLGPILTSHCYVDGTSDFSDAVVSTTDIYSGIFALNVYDF